MSASNQGGPPAGSPPVLYDLESMIRVIRQMDAALRQEQQQTHGYRTEAQRERERRQTFENEYRQRFAQAEALVERLRAELAASIAPREKSETEARLFATQLALARKELAQTRELLGGEIRKLELERKAFGSVLEAERKSLRELAETHKRFQAAAEQARGELKQRCSELAESEERVRARMGTVISQRDILHERANVVTGELKSLRGDQEKARARLEAVEQELGRYKAGWATLSEQYATARKLLAAEREKNRKGQESGDNQRGRNESLERELNALRASHERARREAEEARAATEAVKRELQKRLVDTETEARLELGRMIQNLDGARSDAEVSRAEANRIRREFQARVQSSETQADSESARQRQSLEQTRRELASARGEIERLRGVYPLRDLVAAKEKELERTRQEAAAIPDSHPQKRQLNEHLFSMTEQLERLRGVLEEAEQRLHAVNDAPAGEAEAASDGEAGAIYQ